MPKLSFKAARVNSELSQQQVADMLGVAITTVRNWENGSTTPKLAQFVKLCNLYNVSMDNMQIPEGE